MRLKTKSLYLTLTEAGHYTSSFCREILQLRFIEIKATTSPFLFLSVDLPPPPLFQDAVEKNIIPQVGIHTVLAKYDGVQTQVGFDSFSIKVRAFYVVRRSGIEGSIASVQLSTTSSISYHSLQAVHEK
jgi:hypothetical protein